MADAKIVLSAEDRTKAAIASAKAGLASLEAKATAANEGFARFGAFLGAGFAAGTFTAFVKSTVDGIDRLNDLKDATGASIENLSALEDIAARTGTSFESMSSSVVKFNNSLTQAKAGSDAAAVFDALGLSVAELRKLDPAEALRQTAVALAKFSDDGDKARAVQILFGKSIREVAPLLKDLSEAGGLNAKVTTEQAAAAEKFNNELASLAKNSVDFARSLTGPVITAINTAIEKFREGAKEGKSFVENLFGLYWDNVKDFYGSGDKVAAEIKRITAALEFLENKQAKGKADAATAQRIKLLKEQLADLRREARETVASTNAGGAPGIADPDKPKLKVKEAQKEGRKENLIPGIPLDRREAFRQAELLQQAAVEQALAESKLNEEEKSRANTIALLRMESELASEAQRHWTNELQRIKDQTPTAKLEESRELMRRLADELERGSINAEEFSEMAQTALGTLPEKFQDTTKEMDEFARQAARNIQDALGDTVFDFLSGKFDDIGSRFGQLLKRMAADAIAAQIGRAIFGDFAKSGIVGGPAGAVLGVISSAFGGLFADGGTLGAGKWGIAGEKGPEIIQGPASVVPMTRANGSTVYSNPTIYVDSSTDRATIGQIISGALQAYDRQLNERLRMAGVV